MIPITLSDASLTRVLFAVVLLLATAHAVGYVCQRLAGIPKVIGEIAGGLLLGPTVLGALSPDAYRWLFQAFASEGELIAMISWIGLVLLMFISGFEIQKSIDKHDRRLIAAMLAGSTALPFLVGWFLPRFYDFSAFLGPRSNMLSFTLIIASAVAVTSIPVISKIFLDLDIVRTRFAKIVLATATIEDMILWIALALATAVASRQELSVSTVASKVLLTLGFFAVALLLMPRLFEWAHRSRLNVLVKSSATGYVLLLCFAFAAIASILNVNIIFGAFLAGIVVGMTRDTNIAATQVSIKEMSLGFFTPFYFAVVGLKLDLIHHFDLPFFADFLVVAVVIKTLGTLFPARVAGLPWLTSLNFGIAMNARSGPGIVLATVAFDLGLINDTLFSVLVLLAIVTSLMAGYWLRFVLGRGWKLMEA